MPPGPPRSRCSGAKPEKRSKGGWPGLKPQDLQNIGQKIKEKFQLTYEPRPFQEKAVVAQLIRKDVLIHAGTGMGKTVVAAGPHAHEATKGMVSFMVSPLLALQEEQVSFIKVGTLEDSPKIPRSLHFKQNLDFLQLR
jgi:ATP-dependent helicase YprA (DUF1998 family)